MDPQEKIALVAGSTQTDEPARVESIEVQTEAPPLPDATLAALTVLGGPCTLTVLGRPVLAAQYPPGRPVYDGRVRRRLVPPPPPVLEPSFAAAVKEYTVGPCPAGTTAITVRLAAVAAGTTFKFAGRGLLHPVMLVAAGHDSSGAWSDGALAEVALAAGRPTRIVIDTTDADGETVDQYVVTASVAAPPPPEPEPEEEVVEKEEEEALMPSGPRVILA